MLIIEDNADFALVLKCHLESFGGFRVCGTYRMAEEALAGLRKHPVDIAILDISLYRSNGMDVLRKMSPQMSSIQYLVLTMHEDDETIFSALRAGARGYVLKESPTEEILAAISVVSDGGHYFSAQLPTLTPMGTCSKMPIRTSLCRHCTPWLQGDLPCPPSYTAGCWAIFTNPIQR